MPAAAPARHGAVGTARPLPRTTGTRTPRLHRGEEAPAAEEGAAPRGSERQGRARSGAGGSFSAVSAPLCRGCVSMRDHYPVSRHWCSRYAQRLRAARTVRFPNDVVFQDHIRQGDLEQVGRFIRARKVTLDTIYPSGECAGRLSRGCQGHRRATGPTLGRGAWNPAVFLPGGVQVPPNRLVGPESPEPAPQHPRSSARPVRAAGKGRLVPGPLHGVTTSRNAVGPGHGAAGTGRAVEPRASAGSCLPPALCRTGGSGCVRHRCLWEALGCVCTQPHTNCLRNALISIPTGWCRAQICPFLCLASASAVTWLQRQRLK